MDGKESDLRFSLKAAFREAGIRYAQQTDEEPAATSRLRTLPGKYALDRG